MPASAVIPHQESRASVSLPVTTADRKGAARPPAKRSPGFRADIQGLRAVAVGLVVLYHGHLPGLSGGFVGVDVFFVISGFLITQGLVRELETHGTISLTGFYARRIRRILPAATVTLVGVAVATIVLLPQTQWLQIGRDILSSAVYLVNWDLADRSVDYSALGQAASPLQHFWSLAVEEQFYLLWPLMILVIAGLVRLRRRNQGEHAAAAVREGLSRRNLWLPLALIAVPSLAWSVHLTLADPGPAYFVTTTRMWELALGAALAVAPASLVLRGRPAQVVGWAGLALILYSAVTFDAGTAFPGAAALLPTLGAVAVLAAGLSGDPATQNPLLAGRPMGWVGGLSYSLYLWHWPVLVVATGVAGGQLLTRHALTLVACSVVPAWLSLRLVEQPVIRARRLRTDNGRTLQLGALCMLVALVAGLGVQQVVLTQADSSAAAAAVDGAAAASAVGGAATAIEAWQHPGAAAIAADPANGEPRDSFPSVIPAPINAGNDWLPFDRPGCGLTNAEGEHWLVDCSVGNLAGSTRIALIGDSHAEHLVPAVQEAAVANGWRLDVYTGSGCPFVSSTADVDSAAFPVCHQRNAEITAALVADPPDVVIVAGSRYQVTTQDGLLSYEDSKPFMAQAFRDAWAPLLQAGSKVVSVRDIPRPGVPVPDCVAQHPDQLTQCSYDRAQSIWDDAPEMTAAQGLEGAQVMDLTHWICPAERCPAVIGGVLVYRDTDHMTATYSRTLARPVEAQLVDVLR
jgi:peptidoglycan/LPS O-acetylase OafA/YrhL